MSTTEAKPGWKTSEFLVTVMAAVGTALPLVPAKDTPYVMIAVAVYTAARTVLKSLHALGLAEDLPDLPETPEQVANLQERE